MIPERCDYIIVGAGSAGCVLADRLSAGGKHRVVLLEAGGKDRNPWIHIPLGYGRTMFDARVSGFTLSMCKLRPESRGILRIRSTDPLAAPAIQVNYLADPRDLETMIAGVKLVRCITAAPALAAIIACERDPGPECASNEAIAAFVRAKGISVYHPVGTCRMGPDADAVVDPELRVRGVSGLRVVDASIMPTLVSGNTNAAAILIGEKGADLILASAEQANWSAGQAA